MKSSLLPGGISTPAPTGALVTFGDGFGTVSEAQPATMSTPASSSAPFRLYATLRINPPVPVTAGRTGRPAPVRGGAPC